MKKLVSVLCVLALLASFSACSKKTEAPKPAAEQPAPAPAAPAATPAAPADAAAAAPAANITVKTDALSGTNWKMGDFEISFKDATKVLVKPTGALKVMFPNGLEGAYTLQADGKFEVKTEKPKMTKSGVFDGTNLTIGKDKATKM